jgi:predicted dehydrogenase
MKLLSTLLLATLSSAAMAQATPMKVGIVGLVHGHVDAFFHKSALAPAGGVLDRPDVQLVGIVEPDQALFDKYAQKYHLSPAMHFATTTEMIAKAHPAAVLVFTAPDLHRRIVEEAAAQHVSVMMEKPLAITYADALAMQAAAAANHIHVLVDFETTWYTSNTEAYNLFKQGALGGMVKTVIRDGHQGPVKIGVPPEFLSWLIDPIHGGDGALIDFGCYGPDLMTWLMDGQVPTSVSATTKRMQPDLYPKVDDEADIILDYPNAISIIEGSWNWPVALKQMDLYGRTGYAKAIDSDTIEIRKEKDETEHVTQGAPLQAPYDDPLHYMEAVMSGQIEEGNSLSSLKTNVTVTEILDAAHRSALSGQRIRLPLKP